MSLFLSLESALADARRDVEVAAEALYDAGIKLAQNKAEFDLKAEQVRRLEGALSALHGATPRATPAATVPSTPPPAPKPKPPEGPECPSCKAPGSLFQVRVGTLSGHECSACHAQFL